MVWSAPMTAVENTLLTASQFNVHVRDNLLETEAARATTGGAATSRVWGSDGPNRSAEHLVKDHNIDAAGTTQSDEAYVDLATPGPLVSMTTATGFLIFMNCQISVSTTNDGFASFAVYESDILGKAPPDDSGFISQPSNSNGVVHDGAWPTGAASAAANRVGVTHVWGTVPFKGIYTVKMMYKVSSNDAIGTFQKRRLSAMAI